MSRISNKKEYVMLKFSRGFSLLLTSLFLVVSNTKAIASSDEDMPDIKSTSPIIKSGEIRKIASSNPTEANRILPSGGGHKGAESTNSTEDLSCMAGAISAPTSLLWKQIREYYLDYFKKVAISQHDIRPLEEYTNSSVLPPLLAEKLRVYHSIPKCDEKALDLRKSALFDICRSCLLFSETNFSRVAFDLINIASAKYRYLEELSISLEPFQRPNKFKAFVEIYLLGGFFKNKARLTSRGMPDIDLYRQAIDPYHSDDKSLETLFIEWREESFKTKGLPTFFLWLEKLNRSDKPAARINSERDIQTYKVEVVNNRLCRKKTPLEATKMDFVVDNAGDFYASDEVKHIAFFKGMPVAGAGEIWIKRGKVSFINDNTGHYQTRISHTLQVLINLEKMGVLEEGAIISYIDTQKLIEEKTPPYTRIPIVEFIANPPYELGHHATWIKGKMIITPFHSPSVSQCKRDINTVIRNIYLRRWISRYRSNKN